MMGNRKIKYMILLALSIILFSCVYIVLPEGVEHEDDLEEITFWEGLATNIYHSEAGDLHIDITIQNKTGDWSTMQAVEETPAMLTDAEGNTFDCDTVFIGTGGHRLAPGFQMRGYSFGEADEYEIQPLYVECEDIESAEGSILTIDYKSYQGERDDYEPEKNEVEGSMEINLELIKTDLMYPIANPVEDLIKTTDTKFIALSDNEVVLLDIQRNDEGFIFTWENFNPTSFALKTHIGTPPVIGADGIIYGVYETLDLVSIPLTPAKEKLEWTTEVAVPKSIKGLYILLSVESNKPRTYLSYAVDITES